MTWLNMSIEEISSGRGRSISLVRTTSLTRRRPYVKRRNQVEITRLLLDAGASTETRTDLAGELPLSRAVMENRPDILAVLIGANADVNAHDSHGFAPLHMAVLEEQQPGGFSTNDFGSGESGRTIIRMLLAAGADVNTRLLEFSDKNYTHTPMEIAIEGNCVRL